MSTESLPEYNREVVTQRLAELGNQHPRLMMQEDSLSGDLGDLSAYMVATIANARTLLEVPVLEREMEGRRLLHVSREALRRITILASAWLRTHEDAFFKRAEAELLAVCSFSDWNPVHYLDTAEMMLAVAIGYDWLYHALSDDAREKIAEGLWKHGLQTSLNDGEYWWVKSHNNWGQVCHTGTMAAAIALAERHPEEAERMAHRAFCNLPFSVDAYAPDGLYPEGPMYWSYGTAFNVIFILMTEYVFGTCFGIDQMPGFIESANYMCYVTGPSGYQYNYADSHQRGPRCSLTLLWFFDYYVQQLGGRHALQVTREYNRLLNYPVNKISDRMGPLTVFCGMQRNAFKSDVASDLALDYHARGMSELVTMRSSWSDTNAWFVGAKAGTPIASHGHMDVGSFILEACGVRWAIECGGEDYHNLESMGYPLWEGGQEGGRWGVFRYGVQSHNNLVINDARQKEIGVGQMIEIELDCESPHVKMDLSDAYCRPVTRDYHFVNRAGLVIHDVVKDLQASDVVRWQMLTQAKARVCGSVLTLTQDGQSLTIEPSCDVEWVIAETSELYNPWDTPQENVRRVSFNVNPNAEGCVDCSVTFTTNSKTGV